MQKFKTQTWIKLYRKILNNQIVLADPDFFSLWVVLLLIASYGETRSYLHLGKKYTIKSGQVYTNSIKLSRLFSTPIKKRKVLYVLKTFSTNGLITLERKTRNYLITVNKWQDYQAHSFVKDVLPLVPKANQNEEKRPVAQEKRAGRKDKDIYINQETLQKRLADLQKIKN